MRTEPETVSQAQTWTTVCNAYVAAGLCHRCAAQAAWGHQNGFSSIKPPCESCAPVVATLPRAATKGSPWRRVGSGRTARAHTANVRTTALPGTSGYPLAPVRTGDDRGDAA